MTLDLLDLLLVAQFCFGRDVPWWMWVLGALSTLSAHGYLHEFTKKYK
jgi:hypothetical protein